MQMMSSYPPFVSVSISQMRDDTRHEGAKIDNNKYGQVSQFKPKPSKKMLMQYYN